jgi:hypothetical protein
VGGRIAQHSVAAATLGDQHARLEIDASVLLPAPACGGPSADCGAKNEICLPTYQQEAEMLEGHYAKQSD